MSDKPKANKPSLEQLYALKDTELPPERLYIIIWLMILGSSFIVLTFWIRLIIRPLQQIIATLKP